jgi:hypothetical protein
MPVVAWMMPHIHLCPRSMLRCTRNRAAVPVAAPLMPQGRRSAAIRLANGFASSNAGAPMVPHFVRVCKVASVGDQSTN